MKLFLEQIESQGLRKPGSKILSFKEFCQYVYEPQKRIEDLDLSEKERVELEETIKKRLDQ